MAQSISFSELLVHYIIIQCFRIAIQYTFSIVHCIANGIVPKNDNFTNSSVRAQMVKFTFKPGHGNYFIIIQLFIQAAYGYKTMIRLIKLPSYCLPTWYTPCTGDGL